MKSADADTPALLKRTVEEFGMTLYVRIPLGEENPASPMTGIFLPRGFSVGPQVDVILYLHGHKSRFPSLSIEEYWDRARIPSWPLREGIAEARRNVVLVAPTLGPRSQAGSLLHQDGLNRYIDQVMRALGQCELFHATTGLVALRHLILASHSGGGLPMRRLALSDQSSATRIRECWGFDCTYNSDDDTEWARWARLNPSARLYIYFIPGTLTEPLSRKLEGLTEPNAFVLVTRTAEHDRVPIEHWRERVTGAGCLAPLQPGLA